MLNSLKSKWELIVSYIFIILAIAMLLYGQSNCAGAGCAFALLIAFVFLFVSVVFIIVSLIREIVLKESKKLIYIVIAIVIYALLIFYILQNINV